MRVLEVAAVPTLGMGELIVILLLVVVLFGATRLPALGEGLGKAISSFRRGLRQADDIDVSERPASRPAARLEDGEAKPSVPSEVREAEKH